MPWKRLWRLQRELSWTCRLLFSSRQTQVTMQYLAPFKPISTLCPGTVSVFSCVWLVADALRANQSVSELAHISSVTFCTFYLTTINKSCVHRWVTLFPLGGLTCVYLLWARPCLERRVQSVNNKKSCAHPLASGADISNQIRTVICLSLRWCFFQLQPRATKLWQLRLWLWRTSEGFLVENICEISWR